MNTLLRITLLGVIVVASNGTYGYDFSAQSLTSQVVSGTICTGIATVTTAGLIKIVGAVVPPSYIKRWRVMKVGFADLPTLIDIKDSLFSNKKAVRSKSVSAAQVGVGVASILLSWALGAIVDEHVQVKILGLKTGWDQDGSNRHVRVTSVMLSTLIVVLLERRHNIDF